MGWEWRIVFEGDIRDKFLAHATQACPELVRKDAAEPAEEREDVYVSCSHSVGAKLRGEEGMSDGIEVKRRREVKKRGAELWEKVFAPVVRAPPPAGAEAPPPSVTSDVKSVLQATDFADGHEPTEVSVFKSRAIFKVEGTKGIKIECTLLKIAPEGRILTTVCVESKKDAKHVYEAVEQLALESLEPNKRWASDEPREGDEWTAKAAISYPALVLRIAKERKA